MINAIQISLSGLLANQKKMSGIASNVANMTTGGALDGGTNPPYSAVRTVQESLTLKEGEGAGVKATIMPKTTPFVPSYQPDSPFADGDGMIGIPNVNLAEEAVMMKVAEHSFKANVKVMQAISDMTRDMLHSFDRKV